MFKNSLARLVPGSLVAAGVLLVGGCAVLSTAKPEDQVKQRAQAYWNARTTGQIEKAYELATPSFRKLRTLDQYKTQFGASVAVKSVDVVNVTCEPEKCTVRLKLGVSPALARMNMGTIETHMDETWLLEDGQWWHFNDL